MAKKKQPRWDTQTVGQLAGDGARPQQQARDEDGGLNRRHLRQV
jgi:hypothetical protein